MVGDDVLTLLPEACPEIGEGMPKPWDEPPETIKAAVVNRPEQVPEATFPRG